MRKKTTAGLCLTLIGAIFMASSTPLMAASTTQMKACKMAVLEKQKFRDLPMAAVSVRPGGKENHVAFTVQWDGANGHGNCKVKPDGRVVEVNIKAYNAHNNSHHNSGEIDGFRRDDSGRWIDPDGEVCHSCTPENGFPAAGKKHQPADQDGFYYDRHTGQWRDPSGEVCHSCTPENGFPRQ